MRDKPRRSRPWRCWALWKYWCRCRVGELNVENQDAAKLANGEFAKNAPAEVVAKDEKRLLDLRMEIRQLDAQIARVRKLLGG